MGCFGCWYFLELGLSLRHGECVGVCGRGKDPELGTGAFLS